MTRASTLNSEAGQAGLKVGFFVCCVFVMQITFHPVAQWGKQKKETLYVNNTILYISNMLNICMNSSFVTALQTYTHFTIYKAESMQYFVQSRYNGASVSYFSSWWKFLETV